MRSGGLNFELGAYARALAALLLLCACSDSHGGSGLKPKSSTETGNPPVIDLASVALVVQRDEVHVTGEPGAVMPGGIEVEVETLGSGTMQRGPVAQDGSFDVSVDGTLDDTYVLRALGKQAGAISEPVYLHRGGASVGGADSGVGGDAGGVLTCDQRAAVIDERFAQIEESIDLSCTSNSDCGFMEARVTCPTWYCGTVASRKAQTELMSAVDAIGDDLCDSFAADDCFQGRPLPDCSPPGPAACVEGQCVNCLAEACPETTCAACDVPSVTWTRLGTADGSTMFSVLDCVELHRVDSYHNFSGGPDITMSCSSPVPCIGSHAIAEPMWSVADLQNALGDPELKAALASGGNFSAPEGATYRITVGDDSIAVGPCMLAGECKATPAGVLALRSLLENLYVQNPCTPEP